MSGRVDLRGETAGGRKRAVRLQHPEEEHPSSCTPPARWYAKFRENLDWQDNHIVALDFLEI